MSRVQLSINVSDFDAAEAFYSRLFATEPAKLRPGCANFTIDDPPLKLILNSPGNGPGGTINHLGVEVNPRARSPRRSAAMRAWLGGFQVGEVGPDWWPLHRAWVTSLPLQL